MGTITSKDTRRISFDNTFALGPPLTVQKSIEDDNNILNLDPLTAEKDDELIFTDANKVLEYQEDGGIDYWSRRIINLKKEHRIINKIVESEYEKTIENTNKLLDVHKISPEMIQKMKPCYELRSKIMQCYEDNPRQPLVCTPIVQAFSNCVASCRMED